MQVEWYGQSAFRLRSNDTTVFIDPFGDMSAAAARGLQFGYPAIHDVDADCATPPSSVERGRLTRESHSGALFLLAGSALGWQRRIGLEQRLQDHPSGYGFGYGASAGSSTSVRPIRRAADSPLEPTATCVPAAASPTRGMFT